MKISFVSTNLLHNTVLNNYTAVDSFRFGDINVIVPNLLKNNLQCIFVCFTARKIGPVRNLYLLLVLSKISLALPPVLILLVNGHKICKSETLLYLVFSLRPPAASFSAGNFVCMNSENFKVVVLC